MPCDLAAVQSGGAADDVCKGTLDLKVSGAGGIAEFRLTVLTEATGGWIFASQVRATDFSTNSPFSFWSGAPAPQMPSRPTSFRVDRG